MQHAKSIWLWTTSKGLAVSLVCAFLPAEDEVVSLWQLIFTDVLDGELHVAILLEILLVGLSPKWTLQQHK